MPPKLKDLSKFMGVTFNFLTIIKVDSSETKYRRVICRCICGEEKSIIFSNLKSNSIKSCGCKRAEITREAIQKYYKNKYEFPVERKLFSDYKKDGKSFFLTRDQFHLLVNSNCHYCGVEPFTIRGNKTKSVVKALNGIDRLDSSVGYKIENCVPCCIYCNKAKLDRPIKEFKEWVKKIYNHLY